MRSDHYSHARRSIGRIFRICTALTMGGVTTILLVAGLPSGAFGLGALDLTIGALYLSRRVGLVRTAGWAVVLCILAAAWIPPSCGGRERAYAAALKSDLKNLAAQEEIYYSDNYAYTASVADLGFSSSDGVSIVLHASRTGWIAWATHAALDPSQGCALYYGDGPPPTFLGVESLAPGQIVCTAI